MSPTIGAGESRQAFARPWHDGARSAARVPALAANVAVSVGGPATRPLLFTGLRRAPDSIAWLDAPTCEAYELRVESGQRTMRTTSTRPVIDFRAFGKVAPDEMVRWHITPVGGKNGIGGEFWLLGPEALQAVRQSEQLVGRVEDIEMRAIAQAIVSAEHGLYDEAFRVLEALLALVPARGRGALAHRAFVTILVEMKEKLEPEGNLSIRRWIDNCHRVHLDALARCLPFTGTGLRSSMRAESAAA